MCEKMNIGRAIHSLNNMMKRSIDSYGHIGQMKAVSGTNFWILLVISNSENKEILQKDLQETFGITRSTVSKVVNLMVHKGLIERKSVDYDARVKKLVLTDKSRQLVKDMETDHEKIEGLLTEGFSDSEKEELMGYLERMKNNIRKASGESIDFNPCFPGKSVIE